MQSGPISGRGAGAHLGRFSAKRTQVCESCLTPATVFPNNASGMRYGNTPETLNPPLEGPRRHIPLLMCAAQVRTWVENAENQPRCEPWGTHLD